MPYFIWQNFSFLVANKPASNFTQLKYQISLGQITRSQEIGKPGWCFNWRLSWAFVHVPAPSSFESNFHLHGFLMNVRWLPSLKTCVCSWQEEERGSWTKATVSFSTSSSEFLGADNPNLVLSFPCPSMAVASAFTTAELLQVPLAYVSAQHLLCYSFPVLNLTCWNTCFHLCSCAWTSADTWLKWCLHRVISLRTHFKLCPLSFTVPPPSFYFFHNIYLIFHICTHKLPE